MVTTPQAFADQPPISALEIERREQADEVHQALRTLPDEQRRVIELAYFDGLSQTQIAAALEQPVGTVKGRMRLGLTKLYSQLERSKSHVASAGGVAT